MSSLLNNNGAVATTYIARYGVSILIPLCLAVLSRRAPGLSGECLVGNTSRRAFALLDVFPPRHSTLRAGRPSLKGLDTGN